MKKMRKAIGHWGGLLLLLLLLIACGGSEEPESEIELPDEPAGTELTEEVASEDEPEAPAPNPDAVTLLFAVNGWERGRYEDFVEQFNADNPDVQVEMVSIDEILGERQFDQEGDYLVNLARNADVISGYFDPFMVRENTLLDLAPLLEADPDYSLDDFYPGVLEPFSWDGGVWAMPASAGYQLVSYNKSLFDAAGLDYPEAGWTWEDMIATAQALTIRQGDEVTQWGAFLGSFGHITLIEAYAGPVVDSSASPALPRFESPEVRSGVEWYISLYEEFEIIPFESFDEENGQLLINGQPSDIGVYDLIDRELVAMWTEFSDAYQWRVDQGLDIGVVPFPVSADRSNTSPIFNAGGSTFAISAGSTKADAAWVWIKYLTDQLANQDSDGRFGPQGLPARQSLAESSGYFEDIDPELAEALRYAAEHAFAPSTYNPAIGELDGAIQRILAEGQPVDEALQTAQETALESLAEMEAEFGEREPVEEFTVAEPEPVDPNAIVVEFVVAGGDPSQYRTAVEAFNEANPELVVKVREPNYFNEEFSLANLVGDADCFQWYSALSAEEDIELVLNLEPLFDADPELGADDFFPAVLNQFRVAGEVRGLPGEVSVPLMSYNKRLFDAANLDYPQAGWTLDDFLATAVALTDGDDPDTKVYGFVPSEYEFGDMITFIEALGVQLFDFNSDPPKANFGSPEMIAAISWYDELYSEYEVKPLFVFQGGRFDESLFENRLAMIENDRAGMWSGEEFMFFGPEPPTERDTSHIGYVGYPRGESGATPLRTANGYYIKADTEYRQACWELIKFLSAEPSLVMFGAPSRIDTANDPAYIDQVGAEKAGVYIQALESAENSTLSFLYGTSNTWINSTFYWFDRAYTDILTGELSAQEALTDAQAYADEFRTCVVEREAYSDFEIQEECLREVDPNFGQ